MWSLIQRETEEFKDYNMEAFVKFENGIFNVYNQSTGNSIGKVKIDLKAPFIQSEIHIDDKKYLLTRNQWETTVSDGDEVIYQLKTNSISGNTEIQELNKKIKGVWGLKWGTQLTDETGKTLLRIRNEKKSVDNGNYIIKLEQENLNPLEILIALYGHLYGSSLKKTGVLLGIVAGSPGMN